MEEDGKNRSKVPATTKSKFMENGTMARIHGYNDPPPSQHSAQSNNKNAGNREQL